MYKIPKESAPYIVFFGGLVLSFVIAYFNIPQYKIDANNKQKAIRQKGIDYVFWYEGGQGEYIYHVGGYLATSDQRIITNSFNTGMSRALFTGTEELPGSIRIQWREDADWNREDDWLIESDFNTEIYDRLRQQKIYLPFNYFGRDSIFINNNNKINFTIKLHPNGKGVIYIRNVMSYERYIVAILQGKSLKPEVEENQINNEQWDKLFRRYPWELTVKNMALHERRISSTNEEQYHSQPDVLTDYAPPENIIFVVSNKDGKRKRIEIKFEPTTIADLFTTYQDAKEKLQLQLMMTDQFKVDEVLLWQGTNNIKIPIQSQRILPLYVEPICDNPALEISDDELATTDEAREGEHNKQMILRDRNKQAISNYELRVQRTGDHKYRYVKTDDNGKTIYFRLPLGETIFSSDTDAQYKDKCIPFDKVSYGE